MTPELINMVTVGLALAGLIIGLFAWLRHDIREQGSRLDKRLDNMDKRLDNMDKRLDKMANEMSEIHGRLSRLEGLIEGLFRPRPVMPPPTPDQHNQAA